MNGRMNPALPMKSPVKATLVGLHRAMAAAVKDVRATGGMTEDMVPK
jgi:hypothetical protein